MPETAASSELITLIRRLAALLHQTIDARLKPYGLARTQYVMMQHLDAQPWISTVELAERMQIEPATLSGIADSLQAKGLVKRISHVTDKRRKDIRLTIKGIGLLLSIPPLGPDIEQIMLKGISVTYTEVMMSSILQIIKNLQNELIRLEEGKNVR